MDSNDPQDLVSLVSEVDGLVRGSKSFNLHVTILKRLLNLKDKSSGYEELRINTQPVIGPESAPSESNATESKFGTESKSGTESKTFGTESKTFGTDSETFGMLKTKVMQLKEEVEKSQLLGLCLAYNVQRLQKYSTGSHVDVNSTERVVSELWDKYNETKTGGAILRYEFEEKRRLLRRLRHELEQTRRDWQNFRIRRPEPESDQEKMVWQELRQAISRREESDPSDGADRPGSETDSAVHSDEGEGTEDSNPLQVFDRRRAKLDQLEEDCFRLVSDLVMKHGAPDPDSDPVDSPLLSASLNLADEESSSVEDLDPEELLLAIPDEDDQGSEEIEVEVSGEEEAVTPGSVMTTISSLLTPDIQISTLLTPDIQVSAAAGIQVSAAAEIQVSAAAGDAETRSRASSHSSRVEEEESRRGREESAACSSRVEEEEESRRGREESVAETGEPIVLCRLRRKAVEILISRLREEKAFHETRENELRIKLNEMKSKNELLQQHLDALESDPALRRSKSLALIGFTVLVINIVAAMKVFF